MNPEAEKAGQQQGVVLVSYGSRGVVHTRSDERVDCQYRRSVGRPLCGDEVLIEGGTSGDSVVCEILPRRNLFARADRRQQKQAVAANLDQVVIVVAPSPAPSRDLVERYLVATHSLGIEPLIVLNKAELMSSSDLPDDSPLHRLDEYKALGYTVLSTSCKADPGTGQLAGGADRPDQHPGRAIGCRQVFADQRHAAGPRLADGRFVAGYR